MCNQDTLYNTLHILEQCNNLVARFSTTPKWNDIITKLNEGDADYSHWSELDIVIWYIRNYPEDLKEFDLNLKLNL